MSSVLGLVNSDSAVGSRLVPWRAGKLRMSQVETGGVLWSLESSMPVNIVPGVWEAANIQISLGSNPLIVLEFPQ